MPTYNVYLVNRARYSSFLNWTAGKAQQVADALQGHYARVCEGTNYNPVVHVVERAAVAQQPPILQAGEVVAHILASRADSLIRRQVATAHIESSGATAWLDGVMLSEIYLNAAPRRPLGIANLLFHELMHNKLDSHPNASFRSCAEIHDSGGGGLAQPNIDFQTQLTGENITLMRDALGRQIAQFINSAAVAAMAGP